MHHSPHSPHHSTTSCAPLLPMPLYSEGRRRWTTGELTEIVTALATLSTNEIARAWRQPEGAALRLAPQWHQPSRDPAVQQKGGRLGGAGACRPPLHGGAIRRLRGSSTCHAPRRRLPLAARRSFEAGLRLLRRPQNGPRLLLPPSLSQSFRTGEPPWPLGQRQRKGSQCAISPKLPPSTAASIRPSHATY